MDRIPYFIFQSLSSTTPVLPRPIQFYPAINPWLLFAGAVIAAVTVMYLYSAQRKIAGPRIIIALMTIRVCLVLLVIAMLLGPVRQWTLTTHSNGTLFIALDQSLSMRQIDLQSTDLERLHWAAALGYLPRGLSPGSVGVDVKRLIALQADLSFLQTRVEQFNKSTRRADRQSELASELARCQTDLNATADDLQPASTAAESPSQIPGQIPASLHQTAGIIGQSIRVIQSPNGGAVGPLWWAKIALAMSAALACLILMIRQKTIASLTLARSVPALCISLLLTATALGGWAGIDWLARRAFETQRASTVSTTTLADGAVIPWRSVHDSLDSAIIQLTPVAGNEEKRFITQHGSDPRVRGAIDRVERLDRADLAAAALTSASTKGLKSLADLFNLQDVKIVTFGDAVALSAPERSDIPAALRRAMQLANGKNTDISSALGFISEQAGDDANVLLVSDGRQNLGTQPQAAAQALASRGARVFCLQIGSHEQVRDAAVDHVDAPDWVYDDDEVSVSPVIRLDGLQGQTVSVELHRGDQIVATRQVKVVSAHEKRRLSLTDRPPADGVFDYTVVIPPVANEAIPNNNRQTVRVAVKKDKLNILLVEDDPGWEYQFLRNYLVRDHRVKLQVVLINPAHILNVKSPARIAASSTNPEGTIDAQTLPASKNAWSTFDIVILGDVPPEKFSVAQQIELAGALKDGGTKALLVLAGQRNMPSRYASTPLAELVPVELSGSHWTPQELEEQNKSGFVPLLAPDGITSILGQFADESSVNTALWSNLPPWYWHSEQTLAKPAATVVWSIPGPPNDRLNPPSKPVDDYEISRQRALLATMNVGLGRVMYLASPQTWRLRYVQTPGDESHIEDVHRRFWGQVIRWAAGSELPAGNRFVRFGTDKHTYVDGESVSITARVLDQQFMPLESASFDMVATRSDGTQASKVTMSPAPSDGAGMYRGSMPLPAGDFTLGVRGGEPQRLLDADNSVDTAHRSLAIQVQAGITLEDRDVNADPQMMESIARAGGGIAMEGCWFDVLAGHVPVVDRINTRITQAGLFSDPNDPRTKLAHWGFFTLFVLLLTSEWILRKRGGLV